MPLLRWGILSTAKIGTVKVIPAMQRGHRCRVEAIASRDAARARDAARRLGIPRAYGSYEELLADPGIDAVYNPLPNPLHVPWSIRALEAGKHVLCEKPVALNAAEARTLADAARRFPTLKAMEAFMYRFHPQWIRTRELAASGAIGELRAIQTFFAYHNLDAANIRNRADLGGGGLMDIGCYPISLSRFLFGAEPARAFGTWEIDAKFGTDRLCSAALDFGRGVSAFTVSTQAAPYQRVNVHGAAGRIEIEIPFNAPPDRPTRIWVERGGRTEEIVFDVCDQYTLQGDAFAAAALDGAPVPTPLDDAVSNMRVIDAVARSARDGVWVDV